MAPKLEMNDVLDDKSVVRAQMKNSNNPRGGLRTSWSQSGEPQSSLTTYDLSAALQGQALYKSPGITYDALNTQLSSELQGLGSEARWRLRDDKLSPYDVFLNAPDPKTLGKVSSSPTNTAGTPGAPAAPGTSDNGGLIQTGAALATGTNAASAFGDSLTVGYGPLLKANNRGWNFANVVSQGSMNISWGLDRLRESVGKFGTVCVFNFGTNGMGMGTYGGYLNQCMDVLKDVPRICVSTCIEFGDYQKEANHELHALKDRNSRVVLVDWATFIRANPVYVSGDSMHIHPGSAGPNGLSGYQTWANMILDAIGAPPSG